MTLALGILPPLGLVYLVLFLGDRKRREYLWFAAQMFTGTYYALWTLGVTARFLGTLDIVPSTPWSSEARLATKAAPTRSPGRSTRTGRPPRAAVMRPPRTRSSRAGVAPA